MSDDTVIRVEGLGKKYSLGKSQGRGGYTALRDVLAEKAKSSLRLLKGRRNGKKELEAEEFWALRDVNMEVRRGEVVGIIGRNGAGKSTLLKVLSRITEPTCGRITLKGRVASLLEVGTGFHPELTGRENIFLNGAILGMARREIKAKFDEIVAFAEVERFLDTPVKRYSSGMYVRLAFAVAAHLEPEILIVDEVLAVGDAEFQKKCLGKMQDVAAAGERTVLFVSHNMSAIQSLCNNTVLLNGGRVEFVGPSTQSISIYLDVNKGIARLDRAAQNNGKPTMTRIELMNVQSGEQTDVCLEIEITSSVKGLCSLEIKLFDPLGTAVAFASKGLLDPVDRLPIKEGVNTIQCQLTFGRLARGTFRFAVQLAIPMVEVLDAVEDVILFESEPTPLPNHERCLEFSWGYGAFEIPLSVVELKSTPN